MDAETKQKTKQTDRGEKTSFLSPRNKQIIISSNFNKNFWVINLLLLAGTRVRGKNKMFMMWFWLRCKKLFFWRNKKLKSTKLMMMMKNIELNLIQCKSQKSVRRRRRKNLKLKNQMSHLKLCYSFNCVFREHHYSFLLLRNSNWRQRQRIKSKNSKLFMIFIIRIMMIMMIITRKKWMNEWGERRRRGEQKKKTIFTFQLSHHVYVVTYVITMIMMMLKLLFHRKFTNNHEKQ